MALLACIHALRINRRTNCSTALGRNCAITLEFEQQSTHSLISRIYSPLYCWLSDSIMTLAETERSLLLAGATVPLSALEFALPGFDLLFDIMMFLFLWSLSYRSIKLTVLPATNQTVTIWPCLFSGLCCIDIRTARQPPEVSLCIDS